MAVCFASYLEHAVVDGDGHQSQEKEDDISQGFLPIGGDGYCYQLASDGVHFVRDADQDVCCYNHIENRIVGNENQDAVRVGRQPDVILTCWRVERERERERTGISHG